MMFTEINTHMELTILAEYGIEMIPHPMMSESIEQMHPTSP